MSARQMNPPIDSEQIEFPECSQRFTPGEQSAV
jgi:hypothetical protein